MYGEKNIYILLFFFSKHSPNHEKHVILLMIPNEEGWNYLVVKKLFALLLGITSKHHGDFYCLNSIFIVWIFIVWIFYCFNFYCLNCLHYFATKNKLESHKKVCEKNFFITLLCPLKILKYYSLINSKSLTKHHLLLMQILNV